MDRDFSIYHYLKRHGLVILGFTNLPNNQIRILIGNAGKSLDLIFSQIDFTKENPLDQWTKETLEPLAKRYQGAIEYPFGGPPYSPFIRYAKETGHFFESPIKILIHPQHGLWTGLRGVLTIQRGSLDHQTKAIIDSLPPSPQKSPCDDCPERFCLKSCPVNAFKEEQYDVTTCLEEVRKRETCFGQGCQARLSCPIGIPYGEKQKAFHMKTFLSR